MQERLDQDPLNQIVERHLYRSSTEGEHSSVFIHAVIQDYLLYLKSQNVHIPEHMKAMFIQDLKEEIRELTIKKTFGAVTPDASVKENEANFKGMPRKVA